MKRSISKTVLLFCCLGVPILLLGSINLFAEEEYLFSDVKKQVVSSCSSESMFLRSRLASPSISQVFAERKSILLNLFDNSIFKAKLQRVEKVTPESISWVGSIEGIPMSEVVLVRIGDVLTGSVMTPKARYSIDYVEDGIVRIGEVNDAAVPQYIEPIPVYPEMMDDVEPGEFKDDGSRIDVLVLYTGPARAAAGGTTAMQSLVHQAITQTNQGYANSGITQRVNLVYTAETNYSEAGFNWSQTLSRLRTKNDGYMDEAHTLRNTYNADEVLLIVDYSQDAWGIGYLMNSVSNSFKDWAFAIVTRQSISTAYYTFAHEMGHNMGCHHDRDNASGQGAYSYSYGYWAPDYSFRTIMAYNCPGGCTRVNYWSNPDKTYNGYPMGVAYNQPQSADNRRTLNNTAYTVANFRQSTNLPPVFNELVGTVDAREGSSISFSVLATDPNNDPITYSASSLPSGATFDTSNGSFAWTPSYTQAGTYEIVFQASDGQLTASQTATIVVTNVKYVRK